MKALFINGSPRKNGNTAQLLKRAMDGAREAGAEVELVNLYDRNLNYKGCMSCFACKLKGGKKGVCSFKDDLQPILQKAVEADVLVCGSPNYCGYPSAALRAFTTKSHFELTLAISKENSPKCKKNAYRRVFSKFQENNSKILYTNLFESHEVTEK